MFVRGSGIGSGEIGSTKLLANGGTTLTTKRERAFSDGPANLWIHVRLGGLYLIRCWRRRAVGQRRN